LDVKDGKFEGRVYTSAKGDCYEGTFEGASFTGKLIQSSESGLKTERELKKHLILQVNDLGGI